MKLADWQEHHGAQEPAGTRGSRRQRRHGAASPVRHVSWQFVLSAAVVQEIVIREVISNLYREDLRRASDVESLAFWNSEPS